LHALVQLRPLEEKYQAEVVVIGVHSAKFMAEKATDAVREAVLRYNIQHPVVNDRDFKLWDAYTVQAWPTLMFIDPNGKVIAKHAGEIPVAEFDQILGGLVAQYDKQGLIDRRPLVWQLEQAEHTSVLAFPGKVLADISTNRLFIADTNHNRILVGDLAGNVQQIIGSGEAGFTDGIFQTAQFNLPQGLTLGQNKLFVADTGNHAVRMVDFAKGEVTTLAGTGQQARKYYRHGGEGRTLELNSPWDISYAAGYCYVAMAGFHQLWRLDVTNTHAQPWSGVGREGILDGRAGIARYAQPSGIFYQNGVFFIADSETSAIRQVDPDGFAETLVGTGLFDFGDKDGVGLEAILQHPLGVCANNDTVFIADSYNHKIKQLNLETRKVVSWLGDGTSGYQDGKLNQARFNEPGGLSVAGNTLYIADTNNHAIRTADLRTGEVKTLSIKINN
jgi:DNA-binding beta-propeller fold protein YncE